MNQDFPFLKELSKEMRRIGYNQTIFGVCWLYNKQKSVVKIRIVLQAIFDIK